MRSLLNLKIGCQMPQSNTHTERTLNIKGVGLVRVVTLSGLGKIVGKSKSSLLRYERTDVFPLAPIKKGNNRYYPVSLAKRLIPLVAELPSYKKPDAELISKINLVFKEERDKLLCHQK